MLHILLLILKIVGIILAAVLCLAILAASVLILNPAVYRFDASAEERADTIRGKLKFHWLIHLIRGEVSYESGEWRWDFRIGWKHFRSGEEKPEEAGRLKTPKGLDGSEEAERMENSEGLEEAEGAGSSASAPDQEENADASAPERSDKEGDLSAEASEKEKALSDEAPRKEESQKKRKEASETKTKSLYEKICLRIERVKYTFRRFCDKIRALVKKKDRLTAFLTNETHKRAFRRAVSELRRLLAFLFPKKLKAEVRFGFEDPAYTGYALAWISLLYPAIGDHIDLEPDFQHKVLKGNIYAEGKLRVLYIIIPLWNLVWDKDVRITFRRIRKMKR